MFMVVLLKPVGDCLESKIRWEVRFVQGAFWERKEVATPWRRRCLHGWGRSGRGIPNWQRVRG